MSANLRSYFLKLTSALLLLTLLLTGCRLKEAMDNNFQSESKIEPFAPSDSIAERFGNGRTNTFTLKIPLTQSSLGYFDIDDVLGANSPDRDRQGLLVRIANGFKRALFNVALRFGIQSRMKISSYFELPQINEKYIESARVKKVFFTTEDCRPEETDCDDTRSSEGNFNFIDKFFVNLALDDAPAEVSEDEGGEFGEEVGRGEFQAAVDRSFGETMDTASNDILNMATEPEKSVVSGDDITIMKFENQVPYMNLNTSQITDEDRELTFHVDDGAKARLIKEYFQTPTFKQNFVRRVRVRRGDVEVDLYRDAVPSEFFAQISADQSPLAQKMFIFRIEGRYREAKKYFQKEKFNRIVKDTTMIGRSLFVELNSEIQRSEFLRLIAQNEDKAQDYFDIYKIETCNLSNCLDLDALPVNMGPLLSTGKDVRIDTWLSIRSLGSRDFKYNGYIEVEVVLKNLPI